MVTNVYDDGYWTAAAVWFTQQISGEFESTLEIMRPASTDPARPPFPVVTDILANVTKLTLVERDNAPDSWVIEFADDYAGDNGANIFNQKAPDMMVLYRDGAFRTSGFLVDDAESLSVDVGGKFKKVHTATYCGDFGYFADRFALPKTTDYSTKFGTDYPLRAANTQTYGKRVMDGESMILGYIRDNMTPDNGDLGGSDGAFRLARPDGNFVQTPVTANLHIPVSLARGGTQSYVPKLQRLSAVIADIAERSRLSVRLQLRQVPGKAYSRWEVKVAPRRDVSARVRFGGVHDSAMGTIVQYEAHRLRPTCTSAIIVEAIDPTSDTRIGPHPTGQYDNYVRVYNGPSSYGDQYRAWANALVEELVDQGSQADHDTSQAAGEALLVTEGPKFTLSFTVRAADALVVGPGKDVYVGDMVGWDYGMLQDLSDSPVIVRSITTTFDKNGEDVQLGLSTTPDESSINSISVSQWRRIQRKLGAIDRRTR